MTDAPFSGHLDPANTQQATRPASVLEVALSTHPLIDDCVVLTRTAQSGPVKVAYIVANQPLDPPTAAQWLADIHPHVDPFDYWVELTTLPLTPQGLLDTGALERFFVADVDLTNTLTERVKADPKVTDALVLPTPWQTETYDIQVPDQFTTHREHEAITDSEGVPGPDGEDPPLAVIHGGPLDTTDLPKHLTEALLQSAGVHADAKMIFVHRDDTTATLTYAQLLHQARCMLTGLRAAGLTTGDQVLFQLADHANFIRTFWACTLGGIIPVPLSIPSVYDSANADVQKLFGIRDQLPDAFIVCDAAVHADLGKAAEHLGKAMDRTLIAESLLNHEPYPRHHQPDIDDPALFLATSGSTGFPKLVVQTHRAILARTKASQVLFEYGPDDVALNWLPLDHVGGIVMIHIHDLIWGADQVHVPTERILGEPELWLRLMSRYRVTATWAPNFAFALVNAYLDEHTPEDLDLSRLRILINGGEAVVPQQTRRFVHRLAAFGFREEAMIPTWGMSETASGSILNREWRLATTRDDDLFTSLGKPLPGFSIRVVDEHGEIVREGVDGRLQVSGAPLFARYYQNEAANADAFTQDGWFDTGDQARITNGRLTLTGRLKDLIIINGRNFHAHELESAVESLAGVAVGFTAAVAVTRHQGDAEALAVFFHAQGEVEATRADIRTTLIRDQGIHPAFIIPVERHEIPKTNIGKIQRSKLKKRFQEGAFADRIEGCDAGNKLPAWFFEPVWKPKTFALETDLDPGTVILILADPGPLTDQIIARLSDHPTVWVETGTNFTNHGNGRITLNPHRPEHFTQMLEAVTQFGPLSGILHLWAWQTPEPRHVADLRAANDRGLKSLLFLSQALHANAPSTSLRLIFATSRADADAEPEPEPTNLAHAAVPAMLKTIQAETPKLTTRHLDLAETDPHNAEHLLRELSAIGNDTQIKIHRNSRYVACLQPTTFDAVSETALLTQDQGFYLITGGLGGIGRRLITYLLEKSGMRLLIVGRASFPDPALMRAWDPQRVHYRWADVTDEPGLRAVIEEAETNWELPLAGVFHLAGSYASTSLANLRPAQLDHILEAKMVGSWVLNRILEERPGSLFVGFSSVNGWFGGAHAGAYAAANAFQDALSAYQRRRGKVRGYSFAWSMWDDIGMTQGFSVEKDMAAAKGFYVIDAEKGLRALAAGLTHAPGHLLIGLDATNHFIRAVIAQPAQPATHFTAFYTGAADMETRTSVTVQDPFGTPTELRFQQVSTIPHGPDGQPDACALLSDVEAPNIATPTQSARLEAAKDWIKRLNLETNQPALHFFSSDGHARIATRIRDAVRARLGVHLDFDDLYRNPTIAGLSALLDACEATTAMTPTAGVTEDDKNRRNL